MNKNLFLVSILALLLSACGNNQQSATDEPADPILSSDLAFYRLHGQVKKVTYSDTGLEYEFDAKGVLTSFDGKDPYLDEPKRETDSVGSVIETSVFKKNKEGQIVQILGVGSVNNYTWEDNQVVSDTGSGNGLTWNCDYEHDANGNAIYEHAEYYDVFNKKQSSGTTTYTILSKDEHGNWLERSAKYVPDATSKDEKESAPYKQVRTITYY